MDSRDRSLNREWSRVVAAKSFLHQRHSLSDLLSIPTAPILIFEKDEISIFIHARVAPGIVKKHQREETGRFRGRRCHQHSHQPAETDCLHTKIGSHERTGSRRSVAFIEDEIDYGQYCVQPLVKVCRGRHHVWNARIVDFAFRPDEPLRHRRHWHEKRAGNFVGLEAA